MPDLPDVSCLDWALHRPHAAHDWTSAGFGDAHCLGYEATPNPTDTPSQHGDPQHGSGDDHA